MISLCPLSSVCPYGQTIGVKGLGLVSETKENVKKT